MIINSKGIAKYIIQFSHKFQFIVVHDFFVLFLGPQLQHMEVPRLGLKSELQLLTYTTATAMPDPNHFCDLSLSSKQRCILNPLSKARDQSTSSWILVRFIFIELQWDLHCGTWFFLFIIGSSLPILFFFTFLFWPPRSTWSSWARDQIPATVLIFIIAAASPNPLTRCAEPGSEPAPWCCRDTANPMGTPNLPIFCLGCLHLSSWEILVFSFLFGTLYCFGIRVVILAPQN